MRECLGTSVSEAFLDVPLIACMRGFSESCQRGLEIEGTKITSTTLKRQQKFPSGSIKHPHVIYGSATSHVMSRTGNRPVPIPALPDHKFCTVHVDDSGCQSFFQPVCCVCRV